ncbi:transcriptional regulator with PAS, ATPase and Fis domain [Pullulanibacillus pueri]|uniref:Fis family transcriptional regulator n=1 Tax=Pullulanibacillus pueri TaxID=1437324 RepID=A0A8J2ZVW9_9BACL|nr:sigma-54-dependent transcriptional regulator [Pullulanibacillus pueri]MBM7682369.1 transcriptional regulator with PAS, ATPase and Fis domain [Pullulanibacillus pueri]GGH81909.1 Fis family transcriptional regulator [Pullulanibacillus pueri]
MKIKVLLIAPYTGLKTLALKLAKEQKELDITVREGDLKEALIVMEEMADTPFDIIISRGGTAKLLRENLNQPVIEIPLSGYDILRTLTLIKDYKVPLEMVAFPSICQGLHAVSNLLNINIPYRIIEQQEEVEKLILEAKENGAKVIVGDTITVRIAEKHGLQGILITSGRESVLESFNLARRLYSVLYKYEKKQAMLEKLIDSFENGMAIINSNGQLCYSNNTFLEMLHLNKTSDTLSLFESRPEWLNTIRELNDEEPILCKSMINGTEVFFSLSIFEQNGSSQCYLIRSSYSENSDEDLQVKIVYSPIHSFTQILGASEQIQKTISKARELSAKNIKAIYGEEGAGKTYLAFAMHGSGARRDKTFLELSFKRYSEQAYKRFNSIMSKNVEGTLFIRGVERLAKDDQDQLVDTLFQLQKKHIIFSFEASSKDNLKMAISQKLYHLISHHSIFVAPLRERVEDLDDHIRYFIGRYNEKYGKQIVGIREEALNLLAKRHWEQNIKECEEVVDRLVQETKGEYIEKETVEKVAPNHSFELIDDSSTSIVIPLEDSLEAIEQKIIQKVLEAENMNQTKTAQRLGITRATLWRKLKNMRDSSSKSV